MNRLFRFYNQNRSFIIMAIIIIALIILVLQVLNGLVKEDQEKRRNEIANMGNNNVNNTAITRKQYKCNNRTNNSKQRSR
ncbi:MAG: hypothetical protein HFJ50_09390 [Clostridia bacterium]|jgi:hypothetical protein|nr:hypothetical protein [Clostridia bacterium]